MPKARGYMPGQGTRHGTKAEQKLAQRIDADLTPASGAIDGAKGDMTTEEFRIESKATLKDSFSVKYAYLCKIAQEAAEQNQMPAFAFQFVSPDGKPRPTGSWIAVPEYVWKEMIETGDNLLSEG